jgi:hypothetical protein
MQIGKTLRHHGMRAVAMVIAAAGLIASPLSAQIQTVDPNNAIDSDLVPGAPANSSTSQQDMPPPPPPPPPANSSGPASAPTNPADPATSPTQTPSANAHATGATYQKDDLIGAAEGVFGKGAKGLADIIEKTLKDQGEPNAYIAGREASGAIGVGLRYGSGTLFHKVEGQRDVYWTGPSLGFDLGGNAGNTFVLVYNLYDSQELYKRFPAGEGAAYFIGGFNASYLRWGDVVIIPIRLGVGYRLGANIGYMKFSEKRNWLPF